MPMFSVIVPIYSVEKYLHQCVDSILNQTYRDFELILVDDGSPDSCPSICDEYAKIDSRVKVIHKENGGLVSARQTGVEIARGEYVVCVDGDDWITECCLDTYAKIIEEKHVDIIISQFEAVFENSALHKINRLPYRTGEYDKADIEKEIFPILIQNSHAQYFAPSIWAKAYRKELYKKMQLAVSTKIKIGEDGACTIPCIYNAQSLYITDTLTYYYRQNAASMTKEKKAFDWEGPGLIHRHLQKQIDMSKFDFEEQLYRKTAHELFSVVVSQFNRNEKYKIINRDIREHLRKPIYAECIEKAVFESLNGRMAVCSMRYRWCLLISIFQKLKNRRVVI